MSGILYLCATPIGNLEDMTFRAVKILREVDLIAAEDTRHTRKLLTHFDIHTPLIRYDEFTKTVGEKIIQEILSGKNVACVSDAGMPAISDPGADLVRLAIDADIKISPIPGANAALSALICSGLSTEKFLFAGFLPKSKKNRLEILQKLSEHEETIIFYESPHRLKKFFDELENIFGDRNISIAREITKIHEEFLRGKISDIKKIIDEPVGEFVIICEGCGDKNISVDVTEENLLNTYQSFLAAGLDKKAAIKQTANKFNLGRREVYQAVIRFESNFEE